MVFADGGTGTQVRDVVESQRKRFCLAGFEVLQLAKWACKIEDHYSQLAGRPQPMDIEWAKDGITGELFILQARPETVAFGLRNGGGPLVLPKQDETPRRNLACRPSRKLLRGRDRRTAPHI